MSLLPPVLLPPGPIVAHHTPWPRILVDGAAWRDATARLAAGDWALIGLWGEPGWVHLAVRTPGIAVLSLAAPDGTFPSVSAHHAPAARRERSMADLYGLRAAAPPDPRPWLDHGVWHGATRPEDYQFLPALGEDLHEIPVGPVHAGVIEPGHFRFTAFGETVVRLEQRLGFAHKGTESLLAGADLARGAKLAGRVSGDSTVAYAWAFALACESAADLRPPPRALYLRALMAELERLANHLGDVGAICNDAAFAMLNIQFGILRERVLRIADLCFGHRLMMDRVIPGGVAVDLSEGGAVAIEALRAEIAARLPFLTDLYDRTASLQDRTVGTGRQKPELARGFGAGGVVGRAAGQDVDARRDTPYAPYDRLRFAVPVRAEGDVNARIWVRIEEITQSLALVRQILDALPPGAILAESELAARAAGRDVAARAAGREGMALVESFRGDVLVWLRFDEAGRIARCHLRDPSWFQWPLLEVVIEGNIVADFPLCNKSFNCSYSGVDL